MTISAHSTPKRKRGEADSLAPSPLKFSFDTSLAHDSDDGSNSPRSKVAHRFRGLELREGDVAGRSGGGVECPNNTSNTHDDEEANQLAKRQRQDEVMPDVDEPPPIVSDLNDLPPGSALGITNPDGKTVPQPVPARDEYLVTDPAQGSKPAPEPVPDVPVANDHRKKRAGTPPLRIKKLLSKLGDANKDVVDPVRAALTWHEDEITIYDPDDEDDDGTGINGVGFKPTAAIAHARVMKRRQQMAEYRRREESDARARRNQRRRGGTPSRRASGVTVSSPPGSQGGVTVLEDADKSPRKVRFTEIEAPQVAISTT